MDGEYEGCLDLALVKSKAKNGSEENRITEWILRNFISAENSEYTKTHNHRLKLIWKNVAMTTKELRL